MQTYLKAKLKLFSLLKDSSKKKKLAIINIDTDNFKQISNYIKKFEKSHPTDYIDDLNDYRYWLNKYRVFTNLLNQTNTLKEMKEGEKHVKN